MKILKLGTVYGFACPKCETVFSAGRNELLSEDTVLTVFCPLCSSMVRETKEVSERILSMGDEPNAEQSQ